jgi:hypothetical protein
MYIKCLDCNMQSQNNFNVNNIKNPAFLEVVIMLGILKEKSWSVFLADGYILDNQVKSPICQNCKSTGEVLRVNCSDPNLVLYGCDGDKCRHRLLRVDFGSKETTA